MAAAWKYSSFYRQNIRPTLQNQIRCLSDRVSDRVPDRVSDRVSDRVPDRVRSRQISKYVEHVYHPSQDPSRPLALVGTFLGAKPRYFQNLQQFYMERGFDILYYKGQVKHILHPALSTTVSKPLADALYSDPMLMDKDLHVHAFSVGVFFFGHMLVYMEENPQEFDEILSRIRGVVYDSPATIVKAPVGIAHALTNNPVGIKIATKFFEKYYWFLRDSVAAYGVRSDEIFAKNERGFPVLMMYSNSDIVSKGCAQRFLRRLEENKNAEIFCHTWENTPHANLMRHHTDEYFSLVEEFLVKTGFGRGINIEYEERKMRAKSIKS